MQLTIAGLQHPGTPGDVEANLATIAEAAAEARARGADVLVTPEMFVTGYNIGGQVAELAAGPLVERVAQLAADTGIALVAGLPERLADGTVANTALFVDERGAEVTRYRKTHLFSDLDRTLFVEGTRRSEVVTYRGVRLALLVCYDVEFPEPVRAAAREGAHVVVVPTAQMEPFTFVAETLIGVRAWENQVYVAYVNRSGAEGDLRYVGRSSVAAPSGQVLDALAPTEPVGLVLATVDTDVVEQAQRDNPYLDDLRLDLYPS
ncbi:carbon-nitrogen hydrolase family protein [Microlunatus flavus]|uniref:Predicted amidohydrolase n=1 Tax=Microlunatus flavus TaxID=1036181 RepID=A0A1H9K7N6_9ACTN|nr:carbon-nitrogen hydrolase family protein [Microlunatus flavus]SEQ95082.1 Predicted amidohydrolase [Microlunatus flavus]